MDNPYNYRNKAKYVFGYDKSNKPIMGFFKEGTHHIVSCDNCLIQQGVTNEVAKYIFELVKNYKITIYDEDARKGFLRYVIIKYGVHTNELMIVFVTVNSKMHKKDEIISNLLEKFPNIKTIVQNINEKENNAILGDKNYNLYGKGYIVDYIGEYKFKISPLSFFQVNTIQTEKLYNKAIEYMELTGHETVYDLYSGIGTISLYASKNAKKVYGIEMINDAVKDAIENAKLNKIENVQFLSGKVEAVLPRLFKNGSSIDVVVVDPPRVGLDKKTIETIKEISPRKIVYISCNPETLVENLAELLNDYEVKEVQPVDMFPYTAHVECVVKLVRKK
jgi:23S rRNA (uracil1939-C5)-methyltransferase